MGELCSRGQEARFNVVGKEALPFPLFHLTSPSMSIDVIEEGNWKRSKRRRVQTFQNFVNELRDSCASSRAICLCTSRYTRSQKSVSGEGPAVVV